MNLAVIHPQVRVRTSYFIAELIRHEMRSIGLVGGLAKRNPFKNGGLRLSLRSNLTTSYCALIKKYAGTKKGPLGPFCLNEVNVYGDAAPERVALEADLALQS